MTVLLGLVPLVLATLWIAWRNNKQDHCEFDRNGIHRNGTEYDDFGYNVKGYDRDGYNRLGHNKDGYDRAGYNSRGYDRQGKNRKGQYNRFFDTYYSKDGFCDPRIYPIIVTNHAKERMLERMQIRDDCDLERLAFKAYAHGKSRRQIKKSSAAMVEETENKHENGILLIYKGYIYIFSTDNKLITVYKNDRIPL